MRKQTRFVAGVFALLVMNYRDLFATDVISSFMKPVDEPIVVLGPVLQIFRGILLALVLLPLRKVFFEEKNGLMKLGVIILGLSLLSTLGRQWDPLKDTYIRKYPICIKCWVIRRRYYTCCCLSGYCMSR